MTEGRSELRVLELFAGLGGMRCALAQAKLPVEVKIVAAIDVSELCEKAYCHNFGHAEWKKKTIDSWRSRGYKDALGECLKLQEVDALAADLWLMSPPCQPFTRAGKRKDHEDDRSRGLLHLIRWRILHGPFFWRMLLALNAPSAASGSWTPWRSWSIGSWRSLRWIRKSLDSRRHVSRHLFFGGLPNRRPRYYGLFRASEGAPGLGRLQVSLQDGGCFWRPVATALEAEALLQGRAGPLTEMSFAKEQRYDIHLRSDRTSACLTKANGRLPFGHSPLVLQNEED
eukprot:g1053.t1